MLTCVPDGSTVKNPPAVQEMEEMWIRSLGWEDPQEEEMATTTVFLPGEFHEQRRLAGYSPWGHKESDTTEQLNITCRYKFSTWAFPVARW